METADGDVCAAARAFRCASVGPDRPRHFVVGVLFRFAWGVTPICCAAPELSSRPTRMLR